MKCTPGPTFVRRSSCRARAAIFALIASTALLVVALAPPLAAAFAPIEGVWEVTRPPNALFLIQETGPEHFQDRNIRGEVGCVVDANGFVNPVAILDGELIGSGLEYGGFRVSLSDETCAQIGTDPAVTKIFSTEPSSYRLRTCVNFEGGTPQYNTEFQPTGASTHCSEAVRVRPPEAPVTFAKITTLPPTPACTAAAGRRGRALKLKLSNPINEPLLSAIIKLGSKVVLNYQYPATVPALTKITLPAGKETLTIKVVTTSGKTFTRKRHYGACRPKRIHRHHHHR